MGIFKDDSGKTEKPTSGRLAEAANKGQVPLSKEFVTAGTLLIAVLILMNFGYWLMDALKGRMRHGLQVDLTRHYIDGATITDAILELHELLLAIAWPFLTLMLVFVFATMLCGYGQIGFKIRREAMKIKLERLNPVSNMSKLFSLSSVMRTVISALKLAALGSVLYLVLQARMPEFTMMYEHGSFAESVSLIASTAFEILIWVSLIVLLLSIGDIAWQRFDYIKNLMMSKTEVDDERKRTDGDPLIKSRLRKAAMEIAQQRMMESVPKADVVITNPTHFSVALKYDRGANRAPEVVAKGSDEAAFEIRRIARENDVPLMEDPPLARALFRAVKVGDEVPEKFYQAVAAVLSHVYRLREGAA